MFSSLTLFLLFLICYYYCYYYFFILLQRSFTLMAHWFLSFFVCIISYFISVLAFLFLSFPFFVIGFQTGLKLTEILLLPASDSWVLGLKLYAAVTQLCFGFTIFGYYKWNCCPNFVFHLFFWKCWQDLRVYWLKYILVRVFIHTMKYRSKNKKKNLGRKEFIWLILYNLFCHWKKSG